MKHTAALNVGEDRPAVRRRQSGFRKYPDGGPDVTKTARGF